MLLEKTRMREMMLKARMMFNPMNTSNRGKLSHDDSTGEHWGSQARGGSMMVSGGRCG